MFATGADEDKIRRIEHTIQATITKYTANGKIKTAKEVIVYFHLHAKDL